MKESGEFSVEATDQSVDTRVTQRPIRWKLPLK